MNKEIKFRGQRIDNNEWIYGYYVKDPRGGNRIYCKPFDDSTMGTYYFVKHETVCQLLCEKNGVEIYTGDILRGKQTFENSTEYPLVYVEWNDEQLCYELKKINTYLNPPLHWISQYDKVGNIFDNPELYVADNIKSI